jgi:hypothetical protein
MTALHIHKALEAYLGTAREQLHRGDEAVQPCDILIRSFEIFATADPFPRKRASLAISDRRPPPSHEIFREPLDGRISG